MLLKLLKHNENQFHYINFLIYFTVNTKSNSKQKIMFINNIIHY